MPNRISRLFAISAAFQKGLPRMHAIANVCDEHLEFSNDHDRLLIKGTSSSHEEYVSGIERETLCKEFFGFSQKGVAHEHHRAVRE